MSYGRAAAVLLVLAVCPAVGLGAEAAARPAWSRQAWARLVGTFTPVDFQVATAESVLRAGMTEQQALAAVEASNPRPTGSPWETNYQVESARFCKTRIRLTFRLQDDCVARLTEWSVQARE
jgi:hypothetical protein